MGKICSSVDRIYQPGSSLRHYLLYRGLFGKNMILRKFLLNHRQNCFFRLDIRFGNQIIFSFIIDRKVTVFLKFSNDLSC